MTGYLYIHGDSGDVESAIVLGEGVPDIHVHPRPGGIGAGEPGGGEGRSRHSSGGGWSPPAVPGPSHAELLDNAEACPHRVPMPEGRKSGCGCRWLCAAGNGPRHRKGGVTLMDCWECKIAPRLAPVAPPDDA